MGWGKHFKIRPPDKEDAFPQGVSRGMWGAAPTVAVYRVQRAMPCAYDALGAESRILFAPPRAGARTSAGSFLRVWPGHGGLKFTRRTPMVTSNILLTNWEHRGTVATDGAP